ncbi:homocysteine-responsive endoplasmic reticulum-resident ubiquitin-like domain member 2 protein [Kryptolebias marmoratus]|uniref:homocysteine-responsive endoplasmic reticulum-resident ubiquitin-like domain member 2 protein n=1 Tax=Kryptolebias marmoratus TaxID=37003 RepID=UPI0007F8D2C7|nr:homocysteine-responsive endoplasmic reticulum-resident ubiquitin-like domain member 2 protein [Kryptolebias marmoratus]XP_017284062.1 homocysteine-responsive endoplasmic reticulum-resident ubiquitin-like domain member 2 protein [Kryptolebias marmoratus]
MMHLDCTSLGPPGSPMPQSPSSSSASDSRSSDGTGSPSPATTPNLDRQSDSSSSVPETHDGLRYRGGFPPHTSQSSSGVPPCPDAARVPLQGDLPADMPPNPMYVPMQILWWQQMYARHYYMHYQAAVAAAQPPASPPSSPLQPAQPDEATQPPLGPNPAQNPLQENQPANPVQMNAQGGPVLNDDELNHDWLDWLYTVSRAGVLLSIVYFYSSFSRFVMVVGAMLLIYLHQARWFPFRPEQQNLRGAERPGAPQNEGQRQQDIQEMERMMDEGMEDDDSGEEGVGGPEDQVQAAAALQEPNFLTIAWSFISTFLTSLIPEGRPQPAN